MSDQEPTNLLHIYKSSPGVRVRANSLSGNSKNLTSLHYATIGVIVDTSLEALSCIRMKLHISSLSIGQELDLKV